MAGERGAATCTPAVCVCVCVCVITCVLVVFFLRVAFWLSATIWRGHALRVVTQVSRKPYCSRPNKAPPPWFLQIGTLDRNVINHPFSLNSSESLRNFLVFFCLSPVCKANLDVSGCCINASRNKNFRSGIEYSIVSVHCRLLLMIFCVFFCILLIIKNEL